jgi:hypothetical protein
VVVIRASTWPALTKLSHAVAQDVRDRCKEGDEGASCSGTSHTHQHWLQNLPEGEAETDVASADAPAVIYVAGPWPQLEPAPDGLPRGGVAAPFTEIVRVVPGGQAPRFADYSR